MELHQLRCFVAAAEELHFGKAARRLDMMPSALGRQVRMLEEELGTQLLLRTTRHVMLSQDGAVFLDHARSLLEKADALGRQFRDRGRRRSQVLRIGAIDTAAAGLIPDLLYDFRKHHAGVTIELVEDKTIRLLPKLLSGRLDLAFVRPPEKADSRIDLQVLFHETPVVAVPSRHRLATRSRLSVETLAAQPLIVPERRSRPHSHDLTMKLFERAGLRPTISQIAEEKQTIVNLVAARVGLAIVPRWTARLKVAGVRFVPLVVKQAEDLRLLPLAAARLRDAPDPLCDAMLAVLRLRLPRYAAGA
ncbi:LysR family transcriptional regulator [Bradyrhizobium sp.]|uniref:LysR family transcriptional regulator n=1 Tax=Bradyrhizobium sp. TaxID=376 RepID=UPI001E024294|nr:LysR family transcriptional regulator [Bradyrhizobium sp.]MBI5321134.1 LysR family transcriptional regulator [Bradyrhizobium sp.]